MRYAHALAEWGDAGGYDAEVLWDECCTRAVELPVRRAQRHRAPPLRTFSGGEQKRLALEALLRSDVDVLLLDEPDNFLDVPGKRWLEDELRATRKTILFVSHDRELLAATATKIVTVEASGAWTHGGGFAGYHDARQADLESASTTVARTTTSASGSRTSSPRCAGGRRSATTLRTPTEGGREPAAPVPRAHERPSRSASSRSTMRLGGAAPASGRSSSSSSSSTG